MREFPCFFIMASRHHQAAGELYGLALFDLAIFHLQQSVENGYKAYYLALEFSDIAKIKRDIGHKSAKILPGIYSRIISDIEKNLGEAPNWIKEHISEEEHPISKFAFSINDPVNIPLTSLEKLIDLIQEDNSRLLSLVERFKGKKLDFPEFVSLMSAYQYTIEESFSPLSFILEKHEQRSRYYDEKTKCPDDFYSNSNPLIIKFPDLHKIVEKSLHDLGIFIENFLRFNSIQNS